MITFLAPPAMCALAAGPVVKRPVDSITMSTPRSPQGRLAGSRSARILIDLSPTRIVSPSTVTASLQDGRPTVSYLSRWAMVFDVAEVVRGDDLDAAVAALVKRPSRSSGRSARTR